MGTLKPYTLTYLPTNTDITKHVISIDKFTDADVLYKKNTAELMLSTLAGGFITNSHNGATPILKHLDEFKLEFKKSGVTYSRILFLDTMLPQESSSGRQVQLELFGRERHLEKVIVPGHWYFIHVKDLVKKLVEYYNDRRGTAQPELVYVVNGVDYLDFPDFPFGTFDFNNGTDMLSALRMMVAHLQLPIEATGASDLFSIIFEDHPTDNSKLVLKMFSQGSATAVKDTIDGQIAHAKITRVYERYASNIAVLQGQQGSGSMPPNITEWTGRVEEFDNLPIWRNDIFYAPPHHTSWQGNAYKCLQITEPGISPTDSDYWELITKNQYVGTNFQYSPWTKNKANLYLNYTMNAGGQFYAIDPEIPILNSPAFVDSNLHIRDAQTWQDECIMRITRLEDIPDQYLYSPTTADIENRVYEGMKFLIDSQLGIIQAPFLGNDKYGRAYSDALVQMDEDGDWLVEKEPIRGDHIAVRREGKMYEYQAPFTANDFYDQRALNTGPLRWRDISETPRSNHCFHYPTSIESVPGLVNSIGGNQHINSAIRIKYSFSQLDSLNDLFRRLFTDDIRAFIPGLATHFLFTKAYYNLGWWATLFEAPFPTSTYYNQSENVGQLYGGTIDKKVPVLDANNLNYTPTGKSGFDSSDSNYLGNLDGIAFRFNFDAFLVPVGVDQNGNPHKPIQRPFQGDVPFRCTIYDTEGNVWTRDFAVRFLGLTQEIVLLFSEFKTYRARAPREWFPTLENIQTPELLVLEIPERRKIKRITIQMQDVYDEHGRYDPSGDYVNILEKIVTQILPIFSIDPLWNF